MKMYIKNVLIAIDQLINALTGGWPDETLSSRAYRLDRDGHTFGKIIRPIIDSVFKLLGDDQHCYKSYMSEWYDLQINSEFRNK